jgi:cold shock CspA family protein
MEKKIQSERIFEDILMRENIVTHYLPLRVGPDNVLQEKGIDVWLALEAYEMSIYKKFDIIALVACDGDYVPLVRKLNTLGAHVMLISWEFDYYNENGRIESTRTSRQLLEEVYHPVLMGKIIDGGFQDEFTNNLFVVERETYFSVNGAGDAGGPKPLAETGFPPEAPESDALVSTILNVKEGYGFIEDRAVNNVFFHYSTVENADFNDLKPGMQVRYYREEDEEQSKATASPRFRATKVIVLD